MSVESIVASQARAKGVLDSLHSEGIANGDVAVVLFWAQEMLRALMIERLAELRGSHP